MSKCPDTLTECLKWGACKEKRMVGEEKKKRLRGTLTNIIHNIKMAPIVITDREIKFISSDVSMTGASIG